MSWYKIIFTREQIQAGEQLRFINEVSELLKRAGAPQGAAVFGDSLPDENWRVAEYFSPEAARLLNILILRRGGIACEKPARESVALSVGRQTAWELLNP